MMANNKDGASWFYPRWAAELSKAIEMFTGELPAVSARETEKLTDETSCGSHLWWKQDLGLNGSHYAVWIGAPEATWSALGAAMGGADGGRDIYFELLTQSLQGVAHLLSAGLPKPIVCEEGRVVPFGMPAGVELARVEITISGNTLAPLVAAVDPALHRAIASEDSYEKQPEVSAGRSRFPEPDLASVLNRLIDLELPMSVVLGRAVLPIREVLKLASGSLVELNQHIGDSVEIVIHGMVIARGEVVSVKGNYGVRIREIMSRQDRLALKDTRVKPAAAGMVA